MPTTSDNVMQTSNPQTLRLRLHQERYLQLLGQEYVIQCWKSGVQERLFMKKTFDAVDFQRKVRAELSKQYLENREAFLKELTGKYSKLKKSRGRHTLQITTVQK